MPYFPPAVAVAHSTAGRVAEQMGELDLALSAYESVLRHNPESLQGLSQVASIARIKENYPKVWLPRGAIWTAPNNAFPIRQSNISSALSTTMRGTERFGRPLVRDQASPYFCCSDLRQDTAI